MPLRLISFEATTKSDPVLAAIRHLAAVERGAATVDAAPLGVVSSAWRSLVQPKADLIDGRAYTMCTLEALRHAIRRRDIFVPVARRWGDPRRLLLDKPIWRANQVQVLRSLGSHRRRSSAPRPPGIRARCRLPASRRSGRPAAGAARVRP